MSRPLAIFSTSFKRDLALELDFLFWKHAGCVTYWKKPVCGGRQGHAMDKEAHFLPTTSTRDGVRDRPLATPPFAFLRRPLVGLAFFFTLGTGCGLTFYLQDYLVLGAALAFFLLAVGHLHIAGMRAPNSVRNVPLPLYSCLFFVGWAAVLAHPLDSPRAGARLRELDGLRVDTAGVVAGDPVRAFLKHKGGRVGTFPFVTEQWRSDGATQAGRQQFTILWQAPSGLPAPTYGEYWTLSGTASVFPKKGIRKKRLYLSVDPSGARRLSQNHGRRLAAWCYAARRKAAHTLTIGIRDCPRQTGVMQSLLLGYRERLTDSQEEMFASTGTLHIFAISGTHVVIICTIIAFALRTLGISRQNWGLFLAPILCAYTLATGAAPSAVRACIMTSLYFMAPWLGRKSDISSTLALSVLIILAWSPGQLFEAGFLCSFVVVIGLVAFCPLLESPFRRLSAADSLQIQPEAPGMAVLRSVAQRVVALAALNVAAWISSAPLTAYFFQRFAPIGLLSNFIVIPLAFLSVIAGSLSIVLGPCSEIAAEVFNHANLALTAALISTAQFFAKCSWGTMRIAQPPLWIVVCCYLALVFLAAVGSFYHRSRCCQFVITER